MYKNQGRENRSDSWKHLQEWHSDFDTSLVLNIFAGGTAGWQKPVTSGTHLVPSLGAGKVAALASECMHKHMTSMS